jgi:competence protein ComGC
MIKIYLSLKHIFFNNKIINNNNGFGIMGLIVGFLVISIMSAIILPSFTAKNQLNQAKYIINTVQIIENAENAYIVANTGTSASLPQLEPTYINIPLNGGNFQYYISTNLASISVSPGSNSYVIYINNIDSNYANYIFTSLAGTSNPSCSGNVCNMNITYSY